MDRTFDLQRQSRKEFSEQLREISLITKIDLNYKEIGAKGCQELAQALKNNGTITHIELSFSSIGAEGCQALAEVLKSNNTITNIALDHNGISVEGCKALAESLNSHSTITHVNLDSNDIGDMGCQALAEALKSNTTITDISLEFNGIGAKGCQAWAEALRNNSTIMHVGLFGNNIPKEQEEALRKMLQTRRSVAEEFRVHLDEWQRSGFAPLPVVRLCFVGQGRAGKTTTLRRLKGEAVREGKQDSTYGVELWAGEAPRDLSASWQDCQRTVFDAGVVDAFHATKPKKEQSEQDRPEAGEEPEPQDSWTGETKQATKQEKEVQEKNAKLRPFFSRWRAAVAGRPHRGRYPHSPAADAAGLMDLPQEPAVDMLDRKFMHPNEEMNQKLDDEETFPDGKDALPGMFSARFDGGKIEHKFRRVHEILKEHNFPVVMVDADVGDDFGKATMKYLNKIHKENGVLICVCTDHYAEKTRSPFCSFAELRFAQEYSLDVLPLQVADVFPPRPPGGPDHPYDKEYDAEDLIKMVFRPNVAYKDCRELDEMQIARVIADKLLKKKKGSGHG
ncbi:NLRC3 [Symbiodinium sp. CCMP2592]|nr:NLRC3 [Symbiodinium sp. CCMP2592]